MGIGAVVTSANWVALVLVLKNQVVNCDVYILPAPATLWESSVRLWEVPTQIFVAHLWALRKALLM
jgi:hypothetical protein